MSKPIKDKQTIKQIKEIYIKKNKKRDLLLFLLAINTGLKLNDLLNLNVKDVKEKEYLEIKQINIINDDNNNKEKENNNNNKIKKNNKENNNNNNNKTTRKQKINEIPINKTIQKLIKEITNKRKPKEPLFISNFGGRLDRTLVYKTFKEIINESTLIKKEEKKYFSPSSWRKTFGYHYYQKYKDLSYLQYLFSQQTINETIRYIQIPQINMCRKVQGLNL